ncbi:MAG: tetratricopeptide repeat protein [Candidatus Margulisiibacteriota bacterium]
MGEKTTDFSPNSQNEEGRRFELLGRYEEALKCYDAAITNDSKYPPSTTALENKIRLLGRLGRWEESAKCGFAQIDIQESMYDAVEIVSAIDEKGIAEAFKIMRKMLKKNENNFSALYLMAENLSKEGKYEESLPYYKKACETDPGCEFIWNDAGLAYLELKRNEEALNCFEKTLEINPFNEDIWNNKAIALAELGKKEEALKSYETALEINPDYSDVWSNKGELLYDMGKTEEAFYCRNREIETRRNA